MSKFYDFLTNSKNIKIKSIISNEDKTPNYFLKGLLKKSLLMLLSGSLLLPNISNANTNFGKVSLENLVSKYEKTGIINIHNPNINIVSSNSANTSSHHISGIESSCQIDLAINNTKNIESLSSEKNSINNLDPDLYRETAFNHELSHCVINKKFIGSGLSVSSEKWMQDWVVGDYASFNPIKNLYEENFADTLGMILTLKNHNFSPESIKFLESWKKVREHNRKESEQNLSFLADGHQTDFSLNYVFNNIELIKKTPNTDIEKLAMEISSRSVMYTLNSKRKLEGQSFVNNNGDLVSGKKVLVGNKGISLIQKVFDNYNDTILKNAVSYDYIRKTIKNPPNINSDPYLIAEDIIKKTDIFNKTSSKTVKKEDGTLALKIEGNDINNIINIQFSSNLVKSKFDDLKNKNNFNSFEEEIKNNLKNDYNISLSNNQTTKQKWEKLEKELSKSPFSDDRKKAIILKNK